METISFFTYTIASPLISLDMTQIYISARAEDNLALNPMLLQHLVLVTLNSELLTINVIGLGGLQLDISDILI